MAYSDDCNAVAQRPGAVSPHRLQERHVRSLAVGVRTIDRKLASVVFDIRGRACGDQDSEDGQGAVTGRPVERGRSIFARQVAASASIQGALHELQASPCGGTEECTLAARVDLVRVGAFGQQATHVLAIATPRGFVESKRRRP